MTTSTPAEKGQPAMPENSLPPCAFRAERHRPRLYRYRVANPGLRFMRNRYEGLYGAATIGAVLVIGRHAYCAKWADARALDRPKETDHA